MGFIACDGPKEAPPPEPEKPKPIVIAPIAIKLGYRDDNLDGTLVTTALSNSVMDKDIDENNIYKRIIEVKNQDYLNGKDVLIIPIRLSKVAKSVTLEYSINDETQLEQTNSKILGEETDNINYIVDLNTLSIDLLALKPEDTLNLKLTVLDEKDVASIREVKFHFTPVISGVVELDVLNNETYQIRGSSMGDQTMATTGGGYEGVTLKPKNVCGLDIVGRSYDFPITEFLRYCQKYYHGGSTNGCTCNYSVNKGEHVNLEGNDCGAGVSGTFRFYRCQDANATFYSTNKLAISDLRLNKPITLDIKPGNPQNGGHSVVVHDVKIVPDSSMKNYLDWQIKVADSKIEFSIK